jgi:hypothetical protein
LDVALADLSRAIQVAPQEKYYELRGAILESLKHEESRELISRAKRLVSSGLEGDRERAIQVLGEVLQVDPGNEWAKAELRRLGSDERAGHADSAEHEGVSSGDGAEPGVLASVGKTAAALFGRHLGLVLLFFTILLLFRSPLTLLIVKGLFPRPLLSGSFSTFSFSEVLLLFNAEFHTGVVRVKGESCRGKVYFENGEPCHCSAGQLDGVDALVHLLDNTASGRFDFSEGSMPLNRTINIPLSIILMEHKKGSGDGFGIRRHSGGFHDQPRGGDDRPQQKPKSRMRELLDSKITD